MAWCAKVAGLGGAEDDTLPTAVCRLLLSGQGGLLCRACVLARICCL